MKRSELEKLVETRLKKILAEGNKIKIGEMIWDVNKIDVPKKLEGKVKAYYEILLKGDKMGTFARNNNDSGTLTMNGKDYEFSKNDIRLL